LIDGPRFTGSTHGSIVVALVVTYRSALPYPPGRFDWKISISPSAEMLGELSALELLTIAPRFVGSPKVKSAFATSTARPNTKTNTIEIILFILLSFQKNVNIFKI